MQIVCVVECFHLATAEPLSIPPHPIDGPVQSSAALHCNYQINSSPRRQQRQMIVQIELSRVTFDSKSYSQQTCTRIIII